MKKGKFMGREGPLSLFQQFVDSFQIVQRVVHEELQFGDDAQLMTHTGAQLEAYGLHVPIDVLDDFFAPLRGEYAEVGPCYAHVGADAHGADGNQYAGHGLGLQQEDVTQFLLQESGYFILSGGFHTVCFGV